MTETTNVSPQFIRSLMAALLYWQQRTSRLDDPTLSWLDEERHNLYRIVKYGMELSQTWQKTAVILLQLFELIDRRGYWVEWIPLLQQAIDRCDQQTLALKFQLLIHLGKFLRADKLETAVDTHLQAKAIADYLADEQALAEANLNLCTDYVQLRNYEQAKEHGQAALTQFQQSGSESRLASTLHTLGILALSNGDLPLAKERFTRALTYWQNENNILYYARGLCTLANTLINQEAYDEAEQHYLKAQQLLEETIYELDKVVIYMNLGILYYKRQEWGKAEAAFRAGNTPYLHKSPHIYYQTNMANNLGNVLAKQERWAQAESYLRQAHQLARTTSDDVQLANVAGSLGEVLIAQNKPAEAKILLTDAINLLQKYPGDAWGQKLQKQFLALLEKTKELRK